jgi:hypothetical protein
VASKQIRKKHSERPDLGGRGLIRLLAKDFRRGIGCGSEKERIVWARRSGVCNNGAAEVDKLDLQGESKLVQATILEITIYPEIGIDDYILVLDIAMGDTLAVQVVYGFHDLCEDIPRMILGKSLMFALLNTFEQVVRGAAREVWAHIQIHRRRFKEIMRVVTGRQSFRETRHRYSGVIIHKPSRPNRR